MMNILIQDAHFRRWQGGKNYLSNIIDSLRYTSAKSIGLYVDEPAPFFRFDEAHRLRYPSRFSPLRLLRKAFSVRVDRHLNPWVEACSVGFQLMDNPLFRELPKMHWIADFQHVHKPEFFSKEEIQKRHADFEQISRHADRVIVSSAHAESTFKSLFPSYADKMRVLRFSVNIPAIVGATSIEELRVRYGLPSEYIHFPGQWWQHKNHAFVVDLMEQYPDLPPIVFTGKQDDYRNSDYIKKLKARMEQSVAKNRFFVLEEVPYEDVLSIMNEALAVINPSSYEGWSTTVEEAKTLARPIITSDFPVFSEQKSMSTAEYFQVLPLEKQAWHHALLHVVSSPVLGTQRIQERVASGLKMMGQNFVSFAEELL